MPKGLLERLHSGESVVVAEGYVFELDRRGFLQLGDYVPTVILDRPSAVRNLHEEFALAGSDVIEAFTYYGYREKLKLKGREEELEKLNRDALRIAREVADDYGILMAGNLSNTPLYKPNDPETHTKILAMFKEQVVWAVEGGADFMIGESFSSYGEASLALRAIKEAGNGLPAVVTVAPYFPDHTTDDVPLPEACKRLEDQGADVIGLNCSRGPAQFIPLIKEVQKLCKVPIAALPCAYRTTDKEKTFMSMTDPITGKDLFPDNMDCRRCNRADMRQFAEEAKAAGVQYVGICCGNAPNLMLEVARVYGRTPPAAKYQCDPTKSHIFGDTSDQYGAEMRQVRKFMTGK